MVNRSTIFLRHFLPVLVVIVLLTAWALDSEPRPIADPAAVSARRPSAGALAGSAGQPLRHFHLSDQTSGTGKSVWKIRLFVVILQRYLPQNLRLRSTFELKSQ